MKNERCQIIEEVKFEWGILERLQENEKRKHDLVTTTCYYSAQMRRASSPFFLILTQRTETKKNFQFWDILWST